MPLCFGRVMPRPPRESRQDSPCLRAPRQHTNRQGRPIFLRLPLLQTPSRYPYHSARCLLWRNGAQGHRSRKRKGGCFLFQCEALHYQRIPGSAKFSPILLKRNTRQTALPWQGYGKTSALRGLYYIQT